MIPSTKPVPPPVSITHVLQNDDLVVPVEGGVRRTKAPTAGLVVAGVFVSENDIAAALVSLKLAKRNGRSPVAKFKGRGLVP